MDFLSSLEPMTSALAVGLLIMVAWFVARVILRVAAKLISFLLTAIIAAALVYLALHYLF